MSGTSQPDMLRDEELRRNRLLATFSTSDRALLRPHLIVAECSRGTVLVEPGQDVEHIHFPCDGTMIALVVVSGEKKETAEIDLVGCEGAIGGIISTDHYPAFSRAVVQVPGRCLKMSIAELDHTKSMSPALRDGLARYADCLVAQLMQTIACNRHHALEQRMSRWLLAVSDRQGDSDLPLTQDYLAQILGVQRTSISVAASALQDRGLISYQRGRIRILDVAALQATACLCQHNIRRHFERILPGAYPMRPQD